MKMCLSLLMARLNCESFHFHPFSDKLQSMIDRTLPNWDLSTIFSSVHGDDFKAALSYVSSLCCSVKNMIKEVRPLGEVIDTYNRLLELYETLGSYASALYTTDTSNSEYVRAIGDVEAYSAEVSECENLFLSFLMERKDEINSPDLKDYVYVLSHMLEDARHKMSIAEESLAADLARSGSSAFSRLFDSMTSSMNDDSRTLTQLRSDAYSPDRNVRKSSYEREKKILHENRAVLAAALNGIKGTCLTIEKRQGWSDPLEHSLFISRLSRKAFDALLEALEKGLPVFRRYFRTKAELLGLDVLEWYDLFVPLELGNEHKEYSFSDARDIIVRCYSAFSPEMGDFAQKAFERRWIDAPAHSGKSGGAYDSAFPLVKESRVFTNFSFDYSSVSTLAHELGHAYHDSLVMSKPSLLASYPMTLAETASIFAEQIVFREILKESDEREAVSIIETFVSDAAQVCVDILSRFYFERSLFEKRREGEVSADELSLLMKDAQDRSYGDAVRDKHELMWAVKSHYYSADFSYYNYPYAFGQLFALSLFNRSCADASFASKYRTLLSITGMCSADDAALSIGCDISDVSFWMEGIELIEKYVERLEDFARKM